jgi:hypothetical protein
VSQCLTLGPVQDRSCLMDFSLLRERLAAHKTPSSPLTLVNGLPENSQSRDDITDIKDLSERTGRRLWTVALLDMVAVAWMLTFGTWFDETSRLTAVVTLGGHHRVVLIMAAVGFVMLAGLALLTDGFTSAGRLQRALIIIACAVSVIALAGALSVIILVAAAGLILSFGSLLRLGR